MSEWGVVGVLVALVGLISAVTAPLIKLNSSIVALTNQVQNILDGLGEFKKRYVDNLNELKAADGEMQGRLDDHEHRITVLESSGQKAQAKK